MGEETALTRSMEDYLEAISVLDEEKKYVRVKDIARYMKVKMPSVTGALKSLVEKKLVNHERYEYVELTDQADPQDLLKVLVQRARVRAFEIKQPSLHEIFVRLVGADHAQDS